MDTSCRFPCYKKSSLGFTLIEIMLVIAVVGILAMVTVPKYQGVNDHYHLESSAQIVAMQLRNAKQYAMDRRTEVYVMVNSKSIQTFHVIKNNSSHEYEYAVIENPQRFDSGIKFDFSDLSNEGLKNIPTTTADGNVINNIPLYDKCLVFDRKGFLEVSPVSIILSNSRKSRQSVSIGQTSKDLSVKINWE
ncbi:pilus assembly FimT family protein [Desulfosporosinus shakirovi]|uniref:pilus assembly FimT family protein n=1 Tax=Desulfosporosinus shakirovi TaxID=2885154 RepID=UPI001E3E649E|nr:prepilin-type N-terminal cleavage/methylation domain-containing protein [Desulfosporosinus sp. SRJS8]MCB8817983.1 prepilin-type N-terminal cleavage/methylation domain-containing protein [Desulfosporosinus sp. SRJS8]